YRSIRYGCTSENWRYLMDIEIPDSFMKTGRTSKAWKKKSPWLIELIKEDEWPRTYQEAKLVTFRGVKKEETQEGLGAGIIGDLEPHEVLAHELSHARIHHSRMRSRATYIDELETMIDNYIRDDAASFMLPELLEDEPEVGREVHTAANRLWKRGVITARERQKVFRLLKVTR
ncbi:hypothetical protein LCGC14_2788870, partial [marine sediment metagenome]